VPSPPDDLADAHGETSSTETEPDIKWPPWTVPQLVLALLGPVLVLALSWLLFARDAYGWLAAFLGLLIGSVVLSGKIDASPSMPVRAGLSVLALGTSAVGIAGLYISDEPALTLWFTVAFGLLHLAMFGLNAWKRAAAKTAARQADG